MVKLKENQLVISAFPATGKTYYCSNGDWSQYMPQGFASDSDSSKFDKSNFPQNYIDHINELIKEGVNRIFVSSHKEVRDALVENGIDFVLVYPKTELKDEYIDRYKKRGSSHEFIQLVSNNWNEWIEQLKNQKSCKHIELDSGQFLSNVI